MSDQSNFVEAVSGEGEVLWQLFRNGPTWDGNIISKAARDALFKRGLAARVEGWSFLTREGMGVAMEAGLDKRKEAEDRRRSWRPPYDYT